MNYTPPLWLDAVRYVALGQAIMLVLMVIFVIVRYSLLLRQAPKSARAMPFHVVFISISYVMMLIGSLFELHERVGLPWTWRTIVYPSAFIFGNFALIFMLVHLQVQRVLVGAVLRKALEAAEKDNQEKHAENQAAMKDIAQKVEHVAEVVQALPTNSTP